MKKKFYLAGSILSVASVVPFAVACSGGQKKGKDSKTAYLEAKVEEQKQIIESLTKKIDGISTKVSELKVLLEKHIENSQDAFQKLVNHYNQIKDSTKLKNVNDEDITITAIDENDLIYNADKLQERITKILSAIDQYRVSLEEAINQYKAKITELNARIQELSDELADKNTIIDNAKEDLDNLKNEIEKFQKQILDKINQPKTTDQKLIDKFINEKIKIVWNNSFKRKITTTKTYEAILAELKTDMPKALKELGIDPIVSVDQSINIEYTITRQRTNEFIEINIKISKGDAINSLYNILINKFGAAELSDF